MNYKAIQSYISSSEFNRCKKNGLNLFEPRYYWHDVLSYSWLTRKLRRKIGHLHQMDLLPVIYVPLIGVSPYGKSPLYEYLENNLVWEMLKAEDEIIINGNFNPSTPATH